MVYAPFPGIFTVRKKRIRRNNPVGEISAAFHVYTFNIRIRGKSIYMHSIRGTLVPFNHTVITLDLGILREASYR